MDEEMFAEKCNRRWTQMIMMTKMVIITLLFPIPTFIGLSAAAAAGPARVTAAAPEIRRLCDKTEFRCSNRKCIPLSFVNDTINHCEDNSDEALIPCKFPLYSCRNNRCAMREWVLDGKNDCLDGSDETKMIGTNCTTAVDCCFCHEYVPHSACVSEVCQCDSGYYNNTGGTQCIRRLVGDSCRKLMDCGSVINNSSCRFPPLSPLEGICTCNIGYYESDNYSSCLPRRLSQSCSSDYECQAVIPHSLCSSSSSSRDRVCVCNSPSGYHISSDAQECVLRTVGDSCLDDVECYNAVIYSECRRNQCQCTIKYKAAYNESACVPRQLGDECSVNVDCDIIVNSSLCTGGRCICLDGYRQINKTGCVKRIITDECESDVDCSSAVPLSLCHHNTCVCPAGFRSSQGGVVCIENSIGDDCTTATDCDTVVRFSHCASHSVCLCHSGYMNVTNKQCVKRKLSDSCLTRDDCSSAILSSHCYNNTCICDLGHKVEDNYTVCTSRTIDDICSEHQDCTYAVVFSRCYNGTCQCNARYKSASNDSQCLPRQLGDECWSDIDCYVETSRCGESGQCVCSDGFRSTNNSCVKRIVGDECTVDVDCFASIASSRCNESVCECQDGHRASLGGITCHQYSIGDECTKLSDCEMAVLYSHCGRYSVCVCDTGYKNISQSECVKRLIGDVCEVSDDCTEAVPSSHCFNETCLCDSGRKVENNFTVCTPRLIGDECILDEDCYDSMNYTLCEPTVTACECDEDHLPHPTNASCIPRPVLEQYIPAELPTYKECSLGKTDDQTSGQDHRQKSKKSVNNDVIVVQSQPPQCDQTPDTRCMSLDALGHQCACKGGYARSSPQHNCIRTRSLVVSLNCSLIVGRYVLKPLHFNASFVRNVSSREYWIYAYRLQQKGVEAILRNSSLNETFLSSSLLQFSDAQPGVNVTLALHFTYGSSVSIEMLHSIIYDYLNCSRGEIGRSRIFVGEHSYNESILVEDLDECTAIYGGPLHDCDPLPNAVCHNNDGYFDCACEMAYVDRSPDYFIGRICSDSAKKEKDAALQQVFMNAGCTDGVCETQWTGVIVVTGIIFFLLLILLTIEVICRTKQLRREVEAKRLRKPAVVRRTLVAHVYDSSLDSLVVHDQEDQDDQEDADDNDADDDASNDYRLQQDEKDAYLSINHKP